MRRTTASLSSFGSKPMAPQIPHMASARGIQECAAGAAELRTEMHARDAETVFAEPAEGNPEEGQQNYEQDGSNRGAVGFAFDEQGHGGGFIPAWENAIQDSPEATAQKINSPNANVGRALEGVVGIVSVNVASGFGEGGWVDQLFAREGVTVRIA